MESLFQEKRQLHTWSHSVVWGVGKAGYLLLKDFGLRSSSLTFLSYNSWQVI